MRGAGAQAHLEAVAAFVATWVADVVALVEVEGCGSLAELAAVLRTLPRGGGGAGAAPDPQSAADVATGYLLQGTDSFTEQDVALLTTCALCVLCMLCVLCKSSTWSVHTVSCLKLSDVASGAEVGTAVTLKSHACRIDPSTELTRVEDRLAYPLEGSGCGFDDERAPRHGSLPLARAPSSNLPHACQWSQCCNSLTCIHNSASARHLRPPTSSAAPGHRAWSTDTVSTLVRTRFDTGRILPAHHPSQCIVQP